jgi:hypothetical protein
MANIGTQTTKHEIGDNVHIALTPNTLRPTPPPAPSSGGGISIYTR